MAVLANLRAGGRWLADAALVGATGALLAPLITTAAVLLAIRSFAEMRTAKNLERAFAAMLLCFEGNETDQNWTQRQQSIEELRKLTKNETPKEFPTVYLAGIKLLLDGIIKSAESLRTTLSTNGCRLIKEIAIALGASLDPTMLEKLLPAMISLCGHTKSLNKKNGDETVSAIVGNVPVTYRILQHISASSNDKNFSTRMCTAGWLKIIIEKNGRHCEQHGGLDLIDQCIRTGLQDAKPDVREPMRDTYWTFARKWPDRAESIMSSLDAKARKTLDQHANKLHGVVHPEIKVATTHTTSKTTIAGPAKPSIKDIKLAALRARKVADTTTPENEHGGIITQKPLKEPVTTAPTNKPPVKEMKLAGLRTRKAAETSTTENEDGGVITQNTPKDPIRARKVPETNEDGEAVMTQHPPKDPISAPIAAPTTAPQTVTQAGPRSTFTVTVGPIRNPTQPTLSSAAPKRALLSSAPVRRPRRPDPATTERGRPRLALDHSAPEVADPDTASRSGSPVNEPPAPSAVEYILPTSSQPNQSHQ
jgi:CLIP-associating protein 1/2